MFMTIALLLAATQAPGVAPGQAPGPGADPAFAAAAPSCHADAERLAALAAYFELAPDQTIAEYQPGFVLTDCFADAMHGRGRLIAAVEGGDRIVQVSRRLVVEKRMKRDVARYAGVPLVELKPGKPVPAEHAGSVDRVLITGEADALLDDPKRAARLLRALAELAKPAALLGVVDVPDKGGVDAAKLSAIAAEAGWEPAGQTVTGASGLLLLKFRKR